MAKLEKTLERFCNICNKPTEMVYNGEAVSKKDIYAMPSLIDFIGIKYYTCIECNGTFAYRNGRRPDKI